MSELNSEQFEQSEQSEQSEARKKADAAELPYEETLLTVAPSPHIKSADTTKTIMLDVLIALTPPLLWAVYIFGLRALTVTLVSVVACVLFELWCQLILRRPVMLHDLSAVVTGVLLAYNLPVSVSLWIPVVGAFFAIVLVKQLFGGIGKNIVNPALAARVFLFSSWTSEINTVTAPFTKLPPTSISVNGSLADAVASATPLVSLKNGLTPDISLFDLVLGNCAGVIGEVSALLLAAGGLYLLVRRVITWHIPAAYLGTVALLTYFFHGQFPAADFMLYQLFSGGLFLGAIFMATDYATSPVTKTGRLLYGVGCGLITVFIRFFGGYPEGVSFAILIMNLLVWYIDRFTKPVRFGGTVKNGKQRQH